jgi:superfamily II RNA helicase
MAGRAGRRGLDTVGNVIYFPIDKPLLLAEMVTMLSGPLRVLASNFSITTQYVLRLLKSTEEPTESGMLNQTRKSLLSQVSS